MPSVGRPPIPKEVEDIGHSVIGAAITVHRLLGPGYREVIYSRAFGLELNELGIPYECEKKILVPYRRWSIDGHKLDYIIGGCVVGELKAVPKLRELHRMQVRSYLKATDLRLGLLINFNVPVLKQGIMRVVL